ncbi:MAG TPA: hypothetical protein ENL11_06245 [Candidatus Acetothermia bacterium]|nr:hypothetical protein [Candidatus Acetothermia bacterium]
MGDVVELARFLLEAVSARPEEVKVEYLWTPSTDLVFLKLPGRDRRRLRREDLAALVRVVEKLGRKPGRKLVVDLR